MRKSKYIHCRRRFGLVGRAVTPKASRRHVRDSTPGSDIMYKKITKFLYQRPNCLTEAGSLSASVATASYSVIAGMPKLSVALLQRLPGHLAVSCRLYCIPLLLMCICVVSDIELKRIIIMYE
jgi:hypothetical protein